MQDFDERKRMILGGAAILLNLLSIMVFSMLLIVVAGSFFLKVKPISLAQYSAPSRRRILWLFVLSPWFVGLFAATLVLFSGSQYTPIPEAYDFFHWHHPDEFIFNSWHGLSMALAIICAGFLVVREVKRLILHSHHVSLLHELAEPDQKNFCYLDADEPMAFTAGYIKPRCYMTSALRNQLTAEECAIIELHEYGHAQRLDPLKKWLFQLLASFFPSGVSRQMNQMMVLAMEQCADSAVSRVIPDKSLIAMTLLKVRRLVAGPDEKISADRTICHYGLDNISERISYLLSERKQKVFPYFTAFSTILLVLVVCTLSADIFHHTIEYTLSH